MAERAVSHLVVYGGFRGSTEVPWVTGWHVTREAVALITPGEQIEVFVQFYNHVPNARLMATGATVSWGGPDTFATVASALEWRGASSSGVGWIGPLPHRAFERLQPVCGRLVDCSGAYIRLRMIKSEEEIEWIRRGVEMTDASLSAVMDALEPGATETHLSAAVEESYLAFGGTNHIHFFAATPMNEPARCVPAQWPSSRPVRVGDVLLTELSTSYWGYPGQILRSITIGADPTPLYQRLHDVAEDAFTALASLVRHGLHVSELVSAADLIGDAGFTIYDDLVHGFGGGYLPPIIGDNSRPNEPVPDIRLEKGMTIVIQPNVITPDELAGVQTGEMILVTSQGHERLHTAPRGFLRKA